MQLAKLALAVVLGAVLSFGQARAGLVEDGKAALARKDYTEASAAFLKAAEQGDAKAQYHLGEIYRPGQGVPVDYTEASKWYRKAAEQGDKTSQAILADMCKKGLGVSQDYAEAAKWYKKAADQGGYESINAKKELGLLYEKGLGVPQNIKLGKKLVQEAEFEHNKSNISQPSSVQMEWAKINMANSGINMDGPAKPGDNKSLKVPAK